MAERNSLAEKAYQRLKKSIIYAEYMPGDVLSENKLSEELEMSRTPIRDALSRLSSDGFVTTMKNRGILIRDISYTELFEIAALNQSMQLYTAELAANGLITYDFEKLRTALDQQLLASAKGDYIGYVTQSIEFGRELIAAAHNQTMLDVYDSLSPKTLRMAVVNFKLKPEEKHYSANEVNQNTYNLLAEKKYDEVSSLFRDYMARNRERFIRDGRLKV